MSSNESLCEKVRNALPCFGQKVQHTDTEMHEKVGGDELNKQELIRLESDLKMSKNENIASQRHRMTNFQKNLNIFANTHNINEVRVLRHFTFNFTSVKLSALKITPSRPPSCPPFLNPTTPPATGQGKVREEAGHRSKCEGCP